MKKLFFILLAFITFASCTPPDIDPPTPVMRVITISNDNKPFEYWLNSVHYSSNGPVTMCVPQGTQITIVAVVEVINTYYVIPNVKLYQDNVLIDIYQINFGTFWHQVT
jgi:hypothetical protein